MRECVSLIVPAYNAEKTLARCLEACLTQTVPPLEVIVVDDGSSDGTANVARGFPVRYLRQENRGPAAARNHGAREAQGPILAFTDADCIPERNWLECLTSAFEDKVVAAGGTYEIANPQSFLARMIHAEIVGRHSRFSDKVDFLGSFNVAYRKDAYLAAGGFDESFTAASGEDNDLAYRLGDTGGTLRFVPEARVAHVHPERFGRYLRSQRRHGFWRMKLYAKHASRSRGDHYAGGADFAGPPVALAILALLAGAALPGLHTACAAAALLATVFLLALRIPMAVRLMRATREPAMALYPAMALLRDAARGLGMVHGVWTFMICRKKTA